MMYMLDLTGAAELDGALRTFRFCEGPGGYNTRPNDTPANVHYAPRLNQAGFYGASLFGSGAQLSGMATIDRGEITLNNTDGKLDVLDDYAFDGYDAVISVLNDNRAPYTSRVVVSTATIEAIEIDRDEVRLRLRSRLAILDKPIQTELYAGTTINGSVKTAEGEENLKDVPKLLLYGAPTYVPGVLLNRFYGVFGVGHKLSGVTEVRNKGTLLPGTGQDYPNVGTLIDATVPDGRWATCLAAGLVRVGGNVSETVLYVKATEGASRSVGPVVQRILTERAGLVVGVDFLQSDIDALPAADVGYWSNLEKINIIEVVSRILDSVGAYISPDRLGVFRIQQMPLPEDKPSVKTLTDIEFQSDDFRRIPTDIPASSIILKHSYNFAATRKENLTGNALLNDPQFVNFITQEWRQISIPNASVHKLAEPVEIESWLVSAQAAETEANRRKRMIGQKRKRFEVPVDSRYTSTLNLADVITLVLNRFGLDNGVKLVVVGKREDHDSRQTLLEVWG